MKFNENGHLKFKDSDGDRLSADVYPKDYNNFLIFNSGLVAMNREEARKFAKAIRKQVKLADAADGWMD